MGKDFNYATEDGMLFSEVATPEPEICLGKTFNSAEDRREYYRNELRKYLKDPDFRAIDGFPIGEDEDIIALSDPPYYCACPNPWIPDFIKEWESQKISTNVPYKREPFAVDVSEGRTDPIYNAHSYHTKVPYKAIMKYILHYTNPGDIVYDGFCGTGMTGVAAQLCENSDEELKAKVSNEFKELNYEPPVWGKRRAVLGDLSPLASFIASNYNTPVDIQSFERKAKSILELAEKEVGWMYETKHIDGSIGKINYVVWSDVFICPNCGEEFVFWDVAVDKERGKILGEFTCPKCKSSLSKDKCERAKTTFFDSAINETITQARQKPVQISYTYNGKRYTKVPDDEDLRLLEKIDNYDFDVSFPIAKLPKGQNTEQPIRSHGFSHVHHFYTKRNLILYSFLFEHLDSPLLICWCTSTMTRTTQMYKYVPTLVNGKIKDRRTGTTSGTLYIPSLRDENNPFELLSSKLKDFKNAFILKNRSVIFTNSGSSSRLPDNSIDYIFTDPPFGANIMYSELNFLIEAWLKVKTNNTEEAVESEFQKKGIFEYQSIMERCFAECYRILKSGHWITVEFSNTSASVWNSIQLALNRVGFIIANVASLDKKQGSFKAVTTPTAVKQDLIISLYKPDESFDVKIKTDVGKESVWTFVRKHLEYLPLVRKQCDATITVPERDPRIIYDRMVSYFVSHNRLVPISSPDFLAEIPTRFAERNGLYYLPDQVQEYDKMVFKQQIKESSDSNALFVYDENSAIAWIRAQLKEKPMTLGELTPLFMQELSSSWTKGERKPELRELLEQNFLCYEGKDDVPSFIHGWLSTMYKNLRNKTKDDPELREKAKGRWYIPDPNKASDLEKIREKSLLKEFSTYETTKGKIKEFRIEAVRAGFKKAWQNKNYALIKSICERLPSNIVEEDEKLLMWYSGALTRLGE